MSRYSETEPLIHPINEPDAILETAAIDAYDALIDDEEEYDNDEVQWLREQRTLHKQLHWSKRPSVLMIGLGLFMLSVASAVSEPSRQIIIVKLACNSVLHNDMCDPVSTQILVTNYNLASLVVNSILSVLAAAKVGQLSDKYGRKPFIALIISMELLSKSLSYLVFTHSDALKFKLLIFAESLASLLGGEMTITALANSYISDVVDPNARIYSLGLSAAAIYLGMSIGPMISNLFTSTFKYIDKQPTSPSPSFHTFKVTSRSKILKSEYIPLRFSIFLLTILTIYSIFILPESRSEKAKQISRANSVISQSNNDTTINDSTSGAQNGSKYLHKNSILLKIGNLFNFLKPLWLLTLPSDVVSSNNKNRIIRYRIVVISLILCDCIITGAVISVSQCLIQYGIFKFDWNSNDLANLMTIVASTRSFVLIIFSPILSNKIFHKYFGFQPMKRQLDLIDCGMIIFGYLAESMCFLLIVMSKNTAQVLVAFGLSSFSALASPSISSAVVKFFPESKIGELFGAMSLLKNCFTLFFPFVVLNIYKIGLKNDTPGFVFIVFVGLTTIAIISVIINKQILHLNKESTDELLVRSNSVVSLSRNLALNPSSSVVNYSDNLKRRPEQAE